MTAVSVMVRGVEVLFGKVNAEGEFVLVRGGKVVETSAFQENKNKSGQTQYDNASSSKGATGTQINSANELILFPVVRKMVLPLDNSYLHVS